MDTTKFTAIPSGSVTIAADALDRLLRENDGELALLYLRILRSGAGYTPDVGADAALTPEEAAAREETAAALIKLTALGLILPITAKTLAPPPEIPECTAEQVVEQSKTDLGFRIVVAEAQRCFGRVLSSQELKQLSGIYTHLGLPAEIMLMLINHCFTEYREKFGPGRIPSLRSIEKEGIYWADTEILTLESAEQYTRQKRERSGTMFDLRRAIGLASRELSVTEKKYADSWLDMGFPVEAIAMAYDRTLLKTGSLQWKYMNSILKSWHGGNLHTPAEIKLGDPLKGFDPAGEAVRGDGARQSLRDAGHAGTRDDAGDEASGGEASAGLKRIKRINDLIKNG